MSTPEITVIYERKFSDGNYGSEGLSFSVTTAADPDYFAEDHFAQVAKSLRLAVLGELAKSAAPRVASAAGYELNPPPPRVPVAMASSAPDYSEDNPF